MVVAVPDGDPASELQEFRHDRQLVGVAEATEKPVMTPGQQTLTCILKP